MGVKANIGETARPITGSSFARSKRCAVFMVFMSANFTIILGKRSNAQA
jgi:hypothetical protein